MQFRIAILYVLLALVLTVTNVVASGHASSHNAAGSETCSLCVHATGNDHAITPDSNALQVIALPSHPVLPYASPDIRPLVFCVKSSRAPPAIN